jgi:nitroreductase
VKMLKVMEKRRSVREYDVTPLAEPVMKGIKTIIESMPIFTSAEDVNFIVLENGETVFQALDGIIGYNGHMIEAPHYFLVTCSGTGNDFKVVGYLGEWLALHLAKQDIGICWLSCSEKSDVVMERLGLDTHDHVAAVIAFGEPKEGKKLSKIYNFAESPVQLNAKVFADTHTSVKDENYAYRKAITEIVYINAYGNDIEIGEITKRGLEEVFYYMRYAPSWGNLQPWKFILDGERVVLVMEKNEAISMDIQKIDAGIAMLYFEVAMHDCGLPGKWFDDVDQFKEKLNVPETYEVIGYYAQ